MRMRLIVVVLAAGAGALAGCSTLDDVQVDDTHATKASARVVWRLEGFPKTRRSQGGLEFGYEQYRGNSEQPLAAGHQVTLDSRSLFGPDVLDNKVRIDQVDFSYNHLVTFGRFELEPRGGLAWQQVDLKSRSADPSLAGLATRQHGTYLVAGISPRFNFNHVLALEGRFAYAVGSERRSTDGELALALRPSPGLSLRAGYFMRKQRLQGDGIQSDLNIDLSGPTVSMALRF